MRVGKPMANGWMSLPVAAIAALAVAPTIRAQGTGTADARPELLIVQAASRENDTLPVLSLTAGERIAVRVESDIDVGEADVGPGPVQEAPVGDLIARFGTSGAFAWPKEPVVWIAPASGALVFDVNAYPAHHTRGAVRVEVLRLGPLGAPAPAGFEPPLLQLDRVPGGARARWSDRAGFGVDPASLVLELTSSHGTRYRLAPWVRPGLSGVTLPLPPPGLGLPPGIHTLTATIDDRLGGQSPPSTIRFDTP